ncbi:hypothetical protein H0E87_030599 [Populus deltoides]|uniref:Uncharacterized protein n=1 Tax=Populus deltoides TaxID=3696 RepID=A0A8T2WHZ2_POPDE|nr:hypothetical protein H0E87_030599 [Populus deltoides]
MKLKLRCFLIIMHWHALSEVPMDCIPREDLSLLIDHAANFAVKVFDSPDLLSPQALQTSLSNQLNKFKSCIKKAEFNRFALEEHSFQAPTSPPHLLFENKKSQID